MKKETIGDTHPRTSEKLDNDIESNAHFEDIKVTFDHELMPSGKIRDWFCDKTLPWGYWVDKEGTKRHIRSQGVKEKRITRVLCTVWDISKDLECAIPKTLDILFCNTVWDEPHVITVTTADATDHKKIVNIMRNAGAAVTRKDGLELAEFFRDCYYLRIDEARVRGEYEP